MTAPAQTFSASTLHEDAATARATVLMEAMVAAYALMAHADGEVAPAERRRMFAILRDHPTMTVFSREDLTNEIAEHEANFRFDPELAEQIAHERLARVGGDDRAVYRVIVACRELIPADGIAHPSEYRMLAEIKRRLGWSDDPQRAARPSAV